MSTKHASLTRRNFLLTIGAGGAAAAAAAIAARSSSPAALPAPSKRATRGYHATAHVNDYYRTTKV